MSYQSIFRDNSTFGPPRRSGCKTCRRPLSPTFLMRGRSMNASMIKKRIFAFALTFLLATQMFAPGAAMQVLADELGAPSSGPVALATSESGAAPLAPEASADPAPSEEAAPEESQPEAPDALPTEKDAPSSQEAAPVAAVSVELVTPSVNDTADVVLKKAAAAAGVETDYGGLTISGGTAGTDYALETVAYTRIGRGSNESTQYQDGRSFPAGGFQHPKHLDAGDQAERYLHHS